MGFVFREKNENLTDAKRAILRRLSSANLIFLGAKTQGATQL